jgi:probable HAF family extracellular repeat protein
MWRLTVGSPASLGCDALQNVRGRVRRSRLKGAVGCRVITHDFSVRAMRVTFPGLKIQTVLSIAMVATSLGCGACVDEHAHEPSAPQMSAAARVAANAELRARCTAGLVPPAEATAVITEIPPLGSGLVFMQDINDDGVAVGSAQMPGGSYHAFRYTDLGGVQDLGALPGFGGQSFATAIAPDGAIGGHADRGDATGTLFGYRYSASGGHTEICPGGCSVWDLNASGQVVGLLLGREATTWQAFVWSPGSGLHALGTLGGVRSSASGISESGLVVGNAQLAGSALEDVGHAFIYDSRAAHPALQDLNGRVKSAGWVLRGANDVNERFVVGYGLHDGQSRAFRMSLGTGEVDDLGTLGGAPSVGWAVDGAGDVVGWVAKDAHSNVAVVYGGGLGGLHALNDYLDPAQGWDLQQANGINSHGAIVGTATHQGVPVGFKLTLPLCAGR